MRRLSYTPTQRTFGCSENLRCVPVRVVNYCVWPRIVLNEVVSKLFQGLLALLPCQRLIYTPTQVSRPNHFLYVLCPYRTGLNAFANIKSKLMSVQRLIYTGSGKCHFSNHFLAFPAH